MVMLTDAVNMYHQVLLVGERETDGRNERCQQCAASSHCILIHDFQLNVINLLMCIRERGWKARESSSYADAELATNRR